ncbi:MAG: TetR/AcrR family transcriptional regulator [Actinobacteria bacterium]|nr:TetR/AcrR family transcriptional regulator [Actinomycetota bacterium]
MIKDTKQALLTATKRIFAEFGYAGLSMRQLAAEANISLSVTYHHYKDKEELLRQVFEDTTRQLGLLRSQLPKRTLAKDMLRDRVAFQIDHSEDVVFILKYYMHFRKQYAHNDAGYLPPKAYLHIEEAIEFGVKANEFQLVNPIDKEAKIVAHAINGFLLEYFPTPPSGPEKEDLITSITDFVYRALQGGVVASETKHKVIE